MKPSKNICPNCAGKDLNFKYKVGRFEIVHCNNCLHGFTTPLPTNLGSYYHTNYWISPGLTGKAKDLIFKIFHQRRKRWVKKYLKKGSILEIGAGEGNFIESLDSRYQAMGIEFPGAKIKNPKILKTDYLRWPTTKKFDAIVFWESLEHVKNPQKYLLKSFSLLKDKGLVIIEIPRFDCLEAGLFTKHWFHLDPPRHLNHMTKNGIKKMITQAGFKEISAKSVLAYEYTIWGFVASVLSIFGLWSTDYFKKNKFPIVILVLFPLIALAFIGESFLYLIDESPIILLVARKKQ